MIWFWYLEQVCVVTSVLAGRTHSRLRPWPRLLSWTAGGGVGNNHNTPWGKPDRSAPKTKKLFYKGFWNHCHYTPGSVSRAGCSFWFQTLFVPTLNVWLSLKRLPVFCHGPQRPTTGILSIPLLLGWQDSPDAKGPNTDSAHFKEWGRLSHSTNSQAGSPHTPPPAIPTKLGGFLNRTGQNYQ